jgi:enamine deaminase RidA (YjgF/YER057c/UK114 family)
MTHHPVTSPDVAAPGGPFAPAVRAAPGELLFISGQVAFGPDGAIVGAGDAGAQAAQCLRNVDVLLRAAGGGPGAVVRVVVYLTDIADRAAVAEARRAYFGDHRPAATLVEVKGLVHPDLVVEIEATAVL